MLKKIIRNLVSNAEALTLLKRGELQLSSISEAERKAIQDVLILNEKREASLKEVLWY